MTPLLLPAPTDLSDALYCECCGGIGDPCSHASDCPSPMLCGYLDGLPLCGHCGEYPGQVERCDACGRDPASGEEICDHCHEPTDSPVRSYAGESLCRECLPERDPHTARELERERFASLFRSGGERI